MLLALQLNNLLADESEQVFAPDVEGETAADAETAIEGQGLVYAQTTAYSETVAIGLVISQSPAAGTLVDPGTTVTVTISLGPQPTPTAKLYRTVLRARK